MAGFDWRRALNMEISPLCNIARFCNIDNDGGNAGNNDGNGNNDGGRAALSQRRRARCLFGRQKIIVCVVTATMKIFNKHFTFIMQEN